MKSGITSEASSLINANMRYEMEKAVVISGTRNTYESMLPVIKSVLKNTKVDTIYLLIEDDEFPYRLPEECIVRNVAEYKEVFKYSPNLDNRWTYMVLIRLLYADIFKHLDRILSLDIDVIVNRDICELWDIDMTGYYIAGCKEPKQTRNKGYLYVNAGVMMYNLQALREDEIVPKLIEDINNNKYFACEQDCMNKVLRGHVMELDPIYNRALGVTIPTQDPKIFHFAVHREWALFPEVRRYSQLTWREVR